MLILTPKKQMRYLPNEVILAAICGDFEAIERVINHYGGYIRRLSSAQFYDSDGTSRAFVDDELCKELENKLIKSVLKFNT